MRLVWTEFITSMGDIVITKGPTEDKLLSECKKVFASRNDFSEYFNHSPTESETRAWGDRLGLGYHIRVIVSIITNHNNSVWKRQSANHMDLIITQAMAIVRSMKHDWSRKRRYYRLYNDPSQTSDITFDDTGAQIDRPRLRFGISDGHSPTPANTPSTVSRKERLASYDKVPPLGISGDDIDIDTHEVGEPTWDDEETYPKTAKALNDAFLHASLSPKDHKILQASMRCAKLSDGTLQGDLSSVPDEHNITNEDTEGNLVSEYLEAWYNNLEEPEERGNARAFSLFRPQSADEIQRLTDLHQKFQAHSTQAPSLETAARLAGLASKYCRWIKGTSLGLTPFPYQISGAVWIAQQLTRGIRGGLFSDDMGLGKTIQAALGLQVLLNTREYAGKTTDEATLCQIFGPQLPTCIIVPLNVMTEWEDTIHRYFPEFTVRKMAAGSEPLLKSDPIFRPSPEAEKTIVLTSFHAMGMRWSRKAHESFLEDSASQERSECPTNLTGRFSRVFVDEAQFIKGGGAWSEAIANLRAFAVLLISGTPASNTVEDIEGVLGLLYSNRLWDELHTDPDTNPWEFEDTDPRALLQCTGIAIHKHLIPCTDKVEQGRMLSRVYKKCLLKRSYDTIFEGKRIGHSLPPMKVVTAQLHIPEDRKPEFSSNLRDLATGLFKVGRSGKVIMNSHKHQALVRYNLWEDSSFILGWHQRELRTFRSQHTDEEQGVIPTLRDLLLDMVALSDFEGFDDLDIETCPIEDLALAVAAKSPKLRFLSWLVAYIVLIKREKVVVWALNPWNQELITLFLQALGYANTKAFSSGLKRDEREELKKSFTGNVDGCNVLVGSFLVGSTGMNLHHQCRYTIQMEPGLNTAQEQQGRLRIRRISQEKCQIAINLLLNDSWDSYRVYTNALKAFAEDVAHLTEEDDDEMEESSYSLTEGVGVEDFIKEYNLATRGNITMAKPSFLRS